MKMRKIQIHRYRVYSKQLFRLTMFFSQKYFLYYKIIRHFFSKKSMESDDVIRKNKSDDLNIAKLIKAIIIELTASKSD